VKVYALLSWFDEAPEHLRRCVTSLKGFADVLVGVDGPYASFPHTSPESPSFQQWALSDAVRTTTGLRPYLVSGRQWASEVEKRAVMFELGRLAGATPDDWFLIVDADMTLGRFTPEARERLAATDMDVAEVRWHDVQINGNLTSTYAFRSMFRALPGLTVERTHYLYTVPCDQCDDGCSDCGGTGRWFLWHTPDGHISHEPALDLTDAVTLHHFNSSRDPERRQRALDYYADRDNRTLESAGDWR
jgi:hypothetical protein